MKLLISLFICVSTFNCLAQDTLQFDFNKRIDLNSGYHDGGYKTLYWNQKILTLGYCRDSSSRRGLSLSYLDTLGNVIWNRNYFYPFNDTTHLSGYDIHVINDSLFYVAGNATSVLYDWGTSPIDYDLFLAKFNQQGDSLFFHFLPGEGKDFPVNFLKTESNDLLLLSIQTTQYNDLLSMNTKSFIYKVNATETLDTLLEYYSDLKLPNQLFQYDHKYYIGGTRKTNATSYYYKVYIDVFDTNFTPVANLNPSTTLNEEFKQLFVWQNKLYISSLVTAYEPPNANAFYKNQIACFETGSYTDTVSFGPFSFINDFNPPVVITDSLLVVPHRKGGYHTLFFVDSSGIVRELMGGYPPYATLLFYNYSDGQFATMPGGKIIGIGSFFNNSGEFDDHWVFLTTDVRTYLPESTAGYQELTNEEFSAYPVPFSSELTICRSEAVSATIQLIDLNGKCVLERTIDEKVQKIKTDELPAGTYIFKLAEKGITKEVKVLKE